MPRSISVWSLFRAVPLLALAPACVVSFNDYPVGDLGHEARGGQPSAGGTPTAGNGVGAGGPTNGNDVGGGGSSGIAGGGGVGGTLPLEVAGEAGASDLTGAPNVEPVTIEIVDIVDAYVSQSSPSSNYGNEKTLIMDRNTGMVGPGPGWEPKTHEVLLRASLAELPPAAIVSAASLSLRCSRVGDPITVSFFEQAWQEGTVTWYSTMSIPPGAELGEVTAGAGGVLVIDVLQAVSAWNGGRHGNFGILLNPDGMNATECASSEADDTKQRPRLSVTYTLDK